MHRCSTLYHVNRLNWSATFLLNTIRIHAPEGAAGRGEGVWGGKRGEKEEKGKGREGEERRCPKLCILLGWAHRGEGKGAPNYTQIPRATPDDGEEGGWAKLLQAIGSKVIFLYNSSAIGPAACLVTCSCLVTVTVKMIHTFRLEAKSTGTRSSKILRYCSTPLYTGRPAPIQCTPRHCAQRALMQEYVV